VAQYYTTDSLIRSIKRRCAIPANQSTFTEDDFLAFINEELSLNLVPMIMSLHEDYLLFFEDIPLSSSQSEYTIPARAVGNKLRDVQYVDSNGNVYEMTRVRVGDLPDFQGAYEVNNAYAFYIQNNKVVLTPPVQPSSSGSLRMYYYLRPSEVVSEDRIGIITGINTLTGEIAVDSIPTNFSLGIKYDLYKFESPHRPLKIELDATGINTTTNVVTFNPSDLPSDLKIGDHLGQARECIIPQVPSDLHVVLAQYVAERILEAQGDSEGLRNAKVKSKELEISAGNIIDNRVEDAPTKLVNRNSVLRYALGNKRYLRRK
jgi:hypothetical protein